MPRPRRATAKPVCYKEGSGEEEESENQRDESTSGGDSTDEEEAYSPRPSKKQRRQGNVKKKAEPSAEEVKAEARIRGLLSKTESQVRLNFGKHGPTDQDEVCDALKQRGSIELLSVLEQYTCIYCKDALGLIFGRERTGYGRSPGGCLANPRCFKCAPQHRWQGDWAPSQAAKLFRCHGLNQKIQTECQPLRQADSGWCRGTNLYDDETVSKKALEIYNYSVWDLYYSCLGVKPKQRKKS